jgi:hypothetical protein
VITPEQAGAAEKRFTDEDAAGKARSRADELAPLRKFADEQVKLDSTPVERAQAAWLKLREAVAAGAMTEQQFVRASTRVHAEYAASVAKAAEALRECLGACAGKIDQRFGEDSPSR